MSAERSSPPPSAMRRQAREQGLVVVSHDLSLALSTLGFAALLFWKAADAVAVLKTGFQGWTSAAFRRDQLDLTEIGTTLLSMGSRLLPFFAAALAIICFPRLAQVGFLFVVENALPKFSRINPTDRLPRILSFANITRSMRSFAAFILIAAIAFAFLGNQVQTIFLTAASPIELLPEASAALLIRLLAVTSLGMIGAGIVDYAIRRSSFERSWRTDAGSDRRRVHTVSNDLSDRSKRTR